MSSPANPASGFPSLIANPATGARGAAAAAPALAAAPLSAPALLASMLRTSAKISDLFLSPGKPPLVEISGKLHPAGPRNLVPDDTRRLAAELIGDNQHALATLRENGSCDISYSLPNTARFRVNIFMQRGSCAIVMRVIPGNIPDFNTLSLPAELKEVCHLRNGIVLVTGPTGSGKSSTLAAIIDLINTQQHYHILTIEDPV